MDYSRMARKLRDKIGGFSGELSHKGLRQECGGVKQRDRSNNPQSGRI